MSETPRWFTLCQTNGRTDITLIPKPKVRFWPLSILHDDPVDFSACAGQTVYVDGSSAVWIYAHLAAGAAAAGAKAVYVHNPAASAPIQVYPLQRTDAPHADWFTMRRLPGAGLIVEFQQPPHSSQWPIEVVSGAAALAAADPDRPRPTLIYVTGRGANWMYAAATTQLALAYPQALLTCFMPRQHPSQAVIIHGPEAPGQLLPISPAMIEMDGPGVVLGVVGDPGSGKSVLSKALNRLRAEIDPEISGWVLDCDAASPTPDYFVAMCQRGETALGRQFRDPNKLPWTNGMERAVANQIANARLCMDLLIADLPGGNFRVDPPQRIGSQRALMMSQIDRFVVLGRYGEDNAAQWEAELAKFELDDRIVAMLESRDPQAPPSASVSKKNGRFVGTVSGLDRSAAAAALADGLRDDLVPLLKAVLAERR